MWREIARKRIALVVAHPDDETLGAGAHLKHWPELTIVHVTDGAPRGGADAQRAGFADWRKYAEARRGELDCALRAGEAEHARRIELGVPDQGVIFDIASVIERLRRALQGAEVVITHSYEGGHPDHDACALAARAAVSDSAELWEFAGYRLRNGAIESGSFPDSAEDALRYPLGGADLERKLAMLDCFRTQRQTLTQFRHDVELFRRAPEVDFARPPHPGTLLYETWGFELTGARWRELAKEALACR